MKTLIGSTFGAAVLALSGCATAPIPAPVAAAAPASPFTGSSGMVIGTMSYHYVQVAEADNTWVVHLQRIDGSAAEEYALPVAVDSARHRGIFTGSLPAGVYAFIEAATADRHFPATAVNMPFEVQAGEVRDAGHYALDPLSAAQ